MALKNSSIKTVSKLSLLTPSTHRNGNTNTSLKRQAPLRIIESIFQWKYAIATMPAALLASLRNADARRDLKASVEMRPIGQSD